MSNSSINCIYEDSKHHIWIGTKYGLNLLKFMPDGGKISIELNESDKEVFIKIIDDGKGIAPENLKRLFANFFR